MFDPIDTKPDYPSMERRILSFWQERDIFGKLRRKNENGPKWRFLDGPITANNPMGVHHAWGRMLKDVFHRYHGMLGHRMRYQNGFDCQGLWVEVEVEKELGFRSKKEIEAFGVDRFVEACKERVRTFSRRQTEQSIRLGYWMDWDNSYYTMSEENNYTIWAFLRRCHDRGWVYEGEDVMPWCARCGTGISQQEMHEGYKLVADDAVFVRFPLRGRDREHLLVWTTTPWTLTSNVAVAVNPALSYARVRSGGDVYYLAEQALHENRREEDYRRGEWVEGVPPLKPAGEVLRAFGGDLEVLSTLEGAELVGWTYDGPFDGLPAQGAPGGFPKARPDLSSETGRSCHRVIPWDLVGGSEGTGIVHIAPGCGKEDYELGREHGLVSIAPLDEGGAYLEGFGFLEGRRVPSEEVNAMLFDDMRSRGVLVAVEAYPHSYPHCWRCSEGLIFRQVDEWFISMDELRHEIKEVARKIRWMPSFGLQQELDWLDNMHDWMITKKRYWGLALPIYRCDCGWFDVMGSETELRQRAVEGWEAFEGHTPHRPWIDEVKIRCEACGATVGRIPDVGNPWLDAGIVPYSTLGYRHDRAHWAEWCPFHFITECFPGQFRNWFYSLLAMSTVMENVEPFQTVLGHALVKDEKGEDMHKSAGNVIWFDDAAEEVGVDVMRWMFAVQNPFQNFHFGYRLGREVKRRWLTLWNVCSFFATYAALDRPRLDPPDPDRDPLGLLDRWLLSKLELLVERARRAYDDYQITPFAQEAERFLDELSNWYVRRSRRRFWKSGNDADKEAAYRTLYHAITTFARLLAPILPFTAEEIHQRLVVPVRPDGPESIHLEAFPEARPGRVDRALVEEMAAVTRTVNLALSARQAANRKVRQPLARVVVRTEDDADRRSLERHRGILLEEINVKDLAFARSGEELETHRLRPVMARLGRKHGRRAQAVKAAVEAVAGDEARALDPAEDGLSVDVEGERVPILPGEYEVVREAAEGYAVASDRGITVALDTVLTEELRTEGLSRDVVRRVQNMRKEAGFQVADRIEVQYAAGSVLEGVIRACRDAIMAEILAVSLEPADEPRGDHVAETRIAGETLRLGLRVRDR